jgi:hypothetical protein
MQTQALQDGAESFKVSVHEAARISPVVLFAVGAGGHYTLRSATARQTLKPLEVKLSENSMFSQLLDTW